jgi:hypothetical protein
MKLSILFLFIFSINLHAIHDCPEDVEHILLSSLPNQGATEESAITVNQVFEFSSSGDLSVDIPDGAIQISGGSGRVADMEEDEVDEFLAFYAQKFKKEKVEKEQSTSVLSSQKRREEVEYLNGNTGLIKIHDQIETLKEKHGKKLKMGDFVYATIENPLFYNKIITNKNFFGQDTDLSEEMLLQLLLHIKKMNMQQVMKSSIDISPEKKIARADNMTLQMFDRIISQIRSGTDS